MNTDDFEKRKILAMVGLENRMGKDASQKFLEQAYRESRNELELTGAMSEGALNERVIWRLEFKLDQLVELERKGD